MRYAEPDFSLSPASIPDDPLVGEPNLTRLAAAAVWNSSLGSILDDPVKVGFVDTGFDFGHEEMLGADTYCANQGVTSGVSEPAGVVDNPQCAPDTEQPEHGTSVVTTAFSRTDNSVGLASAAPSDVQIYACSATSVGYSESGYEQRVSSVIDCLQWLEDNDVDVVNISLGYVEYSQAMEEQIDSLWDEGHGALPIAASGNLDAEHLETEEAAGPEYPASYVNVLSVAALDGDGTHWWRSKSNAYVDIAAVGNEVKFACSSTNIECAGATPQAVYGEGNGTSFAAPLVTSAAVAAMNAFPQLGNEPDRVRDWLLDHASDVATQGWDEFTGYGEVKFTTLSPPAPAVAGNAAVGHQLQVSAARESRLYQWQRHNGTTWIDISGADEAGYIPTISDRGDPLRVAETTLNFDGASTAYSTSTTAVVSYVDTLAQDSPAAYWTLEGAPNSLDDASGNSRTAAPLSGATSTPGALQSQASIGLTGGFYDATTLPVTATLTVEAWIKVPALNGVEKVIAKRANNQYQYGCWCYETTEHWRLAIDTNGALSFRANVGGQSRTVTGLFVDDQEWHHVVATVAYDSSGSRSVLRAYVDGQASPALRAGGQVYTHTGYSPSAVFGGANVSLDDVGFYTNALSPSRVQARWSSSRATPPTAPSVTTSPTVTPTGTPFVGGTLTASDGQWSGSPYQVTHQWQRCAPDSNGNNCTDIFAAQDDEYTPKPADIGKQLRVRVTAFNDGGPTTFDTPLFSATTQNPYALEILGDSPSAYWRFDEAAGATALSDHSSTAAYTAWVGSGSELEITGAIAGDAGSGLTGSFGDAVSLASPSSGAMTVESWVKGPALEGSVIGRRANYRYQYYCRCYDTTEHWQLGVDATGRAEWRATVGYAPYTSSGAIVTGPDIADGDWHHVVGVVTFDSGNYVSTLKLYVDGVAEGTVQASGPIYADTWAWPTSTFGGAGVSLDETAYYTSALTATQVADHYAAAQ
ncbi:MAG: S8 family serine peptidase [Solirubrobacteraceae bacterium]